LKAVGSLILAILKAIVIIGWLAIAWLTLVGVVLVWLVIVVAIGAMLRHYGHWLAIGWYYWLVTAPHTSHNTSANVIIIKYYRQ